LLYLGIISSLDPLCLDCKLLNSYASLTTTMNHWNLLNTPPEIVLYICTCIPPGPLLNQLLRINICAVSYLDIPDLVSLSRASPSLATLTADPLLHRTRIFVVNPSRLNHLLFGRSAEGILFRPTAIDLSQRGVLRGLGLERRLRAGMYFYSQRVSDLLRIYFATSF
jgi:hypothetical protein